MKIKIIKITFLVVCIGLFVFLLLPFLETTPPPTQAQLKAQPQVTTDNPLTAIANRLRALFGGKERKNRQLTGPNQPFPRPADEFLATAYAPQTSSQSYPVVPNEKTNTIQVPPTENSFDFGDASFQTDNGEWVLIRQTAPQNGQPGMHEVNVHDNPYDRYVKQERANRALPKQPKPEIPDSKWARLVRPVKRFLGLDTPTPVGSSAVPVSQEDPRAQWLASTKDVKQTGSKYPTMGPARLPFPDITPEQWANMTPEERQREQERRSVAQFTSLLSGEHAAQEAAKIAADAKYPNPKNKQEEQEKQEYKAQLFEQNKEKIKNGILQVMQQNAADKEPVDELSFMLACNSSLPNGSRSCENSSAKPPIPALSEEALAQAQAQNAEKFFEITKYVLPNGLPVTPVFGPTSAETIQQMLTNPDPTIQKTGEVYDFLFNWKKCGERTCFWIPTDKQKDPQLSDAVKAMGPGSHLKADPAHVSEAGREPFAQYKVSLLPDNASDEEKERTYQNALKQYDENAAGLVPYVEELKEVQDKIKNTADPRNKDGKAEDITIFHATDPTLAPEIVKATNSVLLSFEQISLVNAEDRLEAGEQMSTSRGYSVKNATDVIAQEVTEPTLSSAVAQQLSPQKINQKTTGFNQSGTGWEGIFNATKNLGNSSQPGAPKK